MTEYKVHERVLILNSDRCWRSFTGEVGFVTSITATKEGYGGEPIYEIMLDGGDVEYFLESQVEYFSN